MSSIEHEGLQRSEISLLSSSGKPKSFKRGTVPHSVIYMLPIENESMQDSFLKALRKAFPKDEGLGLVSKKTDTHLVYELALRNDVDCNRASDNPIVFQYEDRYYSLKANIGAYDANVHFRVALSRIMLRDHDFIKVYLLNLFSYHGTVQDIVLYEDDPTGSWFSGYGHVLMSCSKTYRLREPPVIVLNEHSSPVEWTRLHYL